MDSEDSGSDGTRRDFKKMSERQMDVEGGSKSSEQQNRKNYSEDQDEKISFRIRKKKFKDSAKGRQYECVLCDCVFYTVAQYNLHIQSFEHRKRMIEKRSNKARHFASGTRTHCAICNVFLNSEKQRTEHIGGSRHKQICFKLNVPSTSLKLSEDHTETLEDTRLHGNRLMCKYCNVEVNSMQQYEEHMKSKNHQLRKDNKKVNHLKSIKKATKMLYAKTKKLRAQEEEAKQDKREGEEAKQDKREGEEAKQDKREGDERSEKAQTEEASEGSPTHEVPVKVNKTTKEEGEGKGVSKVLQKYGFDELHELTLFGGKPIFKKALREMQKGRKMPKPVPYMCDICQEFMNSAFALNEHLLSEEHREKMRMLVSGQQATKSGSDGDVKPDKKQDDTDAKGTSKKPDLYCETCQLMLASKVLYDEHLKGKKHKFLAELKENANSSSKKSKKNAPQKNFYCDICQDTHDSQQAFKEHIRGKKHKFLSALKPPSQKPPKESTVNERPDRSRSKENPQRWQPVNDSAREVRKRQLDNSDRTPSPHERKRRPEVNPTFESLARERQRIQQELEKREVEIEKQRKLVEKLQAEKQAEHEKAVLRTMIDECRQLIQERQRSVAEMEARHMRETMRRERSPPTRTSELWNRSPPPRADADESKHLGRRDLQEEYEERGRSAIEQRTTFWDGPTDRALGRPRPGSCTKEVLNFNMSSCDTPRLSPPPLTTERGSSKSWQSSHRGDGRHDDNSRHPVPPWEGPPNPSWRPTGRESLNFSDVWEASGEPQWTDRNAVPVWEESRNGPPDLPHPSLYKDPAQQQVRETDRMHFPPEVRNTTCEQQPARKVLLETPKQWQSQPAIMPQFEEKEQEVVHRAATTWENTSQSWQPDRNVLARRPQEPSHALQQEEPRSRRRTNEEKWHPGADVVPTSPRWEDGGQNWQPDKNVLPTGPQEPLRAFRQEEPRSRMWLNDEKWHPGTSHGLTEEVGPGAPRHVEEVPRSKVWSDPGKQWRPSANVPIPISSNPLHGTEGKGNERRGHTKTIVSWNSDNPEHIPGLQEPVANRPTVPPQKKTLLPLPVPPAVPVEQEVPRERDTIPFLSSPIQSSTESKRWTPAFTAGFGDVKQENLRKWGRSPPGDSRGSSIVWGGPNDRNWHNSDRNLSKYLRDERSWTNPNPPTDLDPRNDVGKPSFSWGREDTRNWRSPSVRGEALQGNVAHIPGLDFV